MKQLIILISLIFYSQLGFSGKVTEMSEGKILEFKEAGSLKFDHQVKDIGLFHDKIWYFSEKDQFLGLANAKTRQLTKEVSDLKNISCGDQDSRVTAVEYGDLGFFVGTNKGFICQVDKNKVTKVHSTEGVKVHDLIAIDKFFVYSDGNDAKIYRMDRETQKIDMIQIKGTTRFIIKALPSRNQFVAVDTDNTQIRLFDPVDWIEKRSIGRFGIRPGKLMMPKDAAFDPESELLYVSDSNTGVIQAFSFDNKFKGLVGKDGKFLRLKHPRNLLYVSEAKELAYLNPVTSEIFFLSNTGTESEQVSKRLKLSFKDGEPICIECHDGTFVDSLRIFKSTHSVIPKEKVAKIIKTPPKDFPLAEDGSVTCSTCHLQHELDGTNKFLRKDRNDPTLCEECHDINKHSGHPIKAIESGRMLANAKAKGLDLHEGSTIACQTCHDMHQPGVREVGFAKLELCQTCHLQGGSDFTQHTKQDLKGKELDCFSCHQVHGGSRELSLVINDSESSLNTCLSCHKNKKFAGHGSHSHNNPKFTATQMYKERGFQKNPCLTCHKFHSSNKGLILGMTDAVDSENVRDIQSRLCLECHKENRAHTKRFYEHDTELTFDKIPQFSSKLKIYDLRGNAFDTHRDQKGRIGCLTCHSPHVGKDGEGGKINYKLITPFCVICHKSEGLFRYKYFHTDKYRKGGNK